MSDLRENIEALVESIDKQIGKAGTVDTEDDYQEGQVDGALTAFVEVRTRLKNILRLDSLRQVLDKP